MGAKLRILSIGHSYVVGGNRRLAHAIQKAAGDSCDVQVAAPSYFHGGKDLRPVKITVKDQEDCTVTILPAHLTRFVHFFSYGKGVRQLLASNWNLVHAWEEPYILAGAQLAALTPNQTKFVFRTAQSNNKSYIPPFNRIEKYTLGRANGWICSGQTVSANLKDRSGYASKPMARIPLGVDTNVFRPDPEAGAQIRRQLDWKPEGPPVIGFLGRFVPEKGLPLLMNALSKLKTRWRSLLVGSGPLEPTIRKWAARFPEQVRICTDVSHDNVPNYLNAMDLLTVPSQTTPRWREQFGRMLIEAMACGVPVLGSDSGEIPHVLQNNGEVVSESDEAGWIEKLNELLESPAKRETLAARGVVAANEQYSWDHIGKQYFSFFNKILGSTQTKPSLTFPQETLAYLRTA